MTPEKMKLIADLHYECYSAMLGLSLHHSGKAKLTRTAYNDECVRFCEASDQLERITGKAFGEAFNTWFEGEDLRQSVSIKRESVVITAERVLAG